MEIELNGHKITYIQRLFFCEEQNSTTPYLTCDQTLLEAQPTFSCMSLCNLD